MSLSRPGSPAQQRTDRRRYACERGKGGRGRRERGEGGLVRCVYVRGSRCIALDYALVKVSSRWRKVEGQCQRDRRSQVNSGPEARIIKSREITDANHVIHGDSKEKFPKKKEISPARIGRGIFLRVPRYGFQLVFAETRRAAAIRAPELLRLHFFGRLKMEISEYSFPRMPSIVTLKW